MGTKPGESAGGGRDCRGRGHQRRSGIDTARDESDGVGDVAEQKARHTGEKELGRIARDQEDVAEPGKHEAGQDGSAVGRAGRPGRERDRDERRRRGGLRDPHARA